MSTSPRERALHDAQEALILIDTTIEESHYGGVDGVDIVDAGIEGMASALARLFAFPMAIEERSPSLDDVLAFLVLKDRIEEDAVGLAERLTETLGQAGYTGLSPSDVERAEEMRRALYEHLEALLCEAEREMSDA